MRNSWNSTIGRVALSASLLAAAGCASAGGARPAPFPSRLVPPSNPSRASYEEVVRVALGYVGAPYRLGGESPGSGFDCSGFVRYVLSVAANVDVPRTVSEQFHIGTHVVQAEIRAGDLVFFSAGPDGPSHVGLALNGIEFIHAPGERGAVRVERLDAAYWRARLVGARRLLQGAGTGRGT